LKAGSRAAGLEQLAQPAGTSPAYAKQAAIWVSKVRAFTIWPSEVLGGERAQITGRVESAGLLGCVPGPLDPFCWLGVRLAR